MALLIWRIPISEMGASLTLLDARAVVGGLALSLAGSWLSGVRLWVLEPAIRLGPAIRVTFVSIYYSTVLPGQVAGDAVKAYRLSNGPLTLGQAAAATLTDRALATLALLFVSACAAPWVAQVPRNLALLLAAASASVMLGMFALAVPRIHSKVVEWLPPDDRVGVRAFLGRVAEGLNSYLSHPSRILGCFAIALAFHGIGLAIHLVVGGALGIELTAKVWFLVYGAVALLMLIPVSLAGLGLREGGYVGLLALFGVPSPPALALSVVFFAFTLITALIGSLAELTGARPTDSERKTN
jgi:glycosyltransferase 2 family protein